MCSKESPAKRKVEEQEGVAQQVPSKKPRQQTLAESLGLGSNPTSSNAQASLSSPHTPKSLQHDINSTCGWHNLGQGSRLGYWPRHIKSTQAAEIFRELYQGTKWLQKDVRVMGKTLPQPRLIAYCALDTSKGYSYSGLQLQPTPFTPLLNKLRLLAEEELAGASFDSVLLNLYRDGSDCVGWHADTEKIYGPEPTIASLSFGQERDFILRSKDDHKKQIKLSLASGDVLVMAGTLQQHWMHTVPRRLPAIKYGPRINLTYRKVDL